MVQSMLSYMVGRLTICYLEQSGGTFPHVCSLVPVPCMLQFLALLSTQFKGVLFHSLSVSSYYLIQLLIFISHRASSRYSLAVLLRIK